MIQARPWHGGDRSAGAAALILLATWIGLPSAVRAEDGLRYRIDAALDLGERRLEGRVRFVLRNVSKCTLGKFLLFTYPNHYSRIDPSLTDEIFDRVYPDGVSLGEMSIGGVRVAERPASFRFTESEGLPPRTLLEIDMPEPLPPGASVEVDAEFRLAIPRRFGSFGEFSGDLCLNGGWHPYLPALREDGTWGVREPPPRASFDLRLRIPEGGELILNGRRIRVPPGSPDPVEAAVEGAFLTLLVSPELHVYRHSCDRDEVTYFRQTPRERDARKLLDTVHEAVRYLPGRGVVLPRVKIRLAEAHLRRDLVMTGEGVTLVSDRFLEVVFVGEKYHLGPVVEAVYTQIFRGLLAGREGSAQLPWTSEAAAWVCAEPFYDEILAGPKTVKGILAPFGIFTAVDRLIHAPRFPFVRAFYGGFYERDPLREDISRFNTDTPHGRVLAEKLRDILGDDTVTGIVRRVLSGEGTTRALAEETYGGDLGWFFSQWRQPLPRMNYRLLDTRQTPSPGGGYLTEVRIRREGDQVREPVDVEVKKFLGRSWSGRWDGEGEEGTARFVTEERTWSTRIDPHKRLWETTRVDNHWPPTAKFLIDRVRVKIDLNGRDHEAVVGGGFVFNNDYRNRYLVTLFSTEEQDGVALGYSRSFGQVIDPTRYRQGVFVGAKHTALDPDFATNRSGRLNDVGNVSAFNVGYRINTIQTSRNPQSGFSIGISGEYADRILGSDFRYWKGAIGGEWIFPIVRDRHIAALRADFGGSRSKGTPTQLLWDVGGFGGVRGINTGDFLGHFFWNATAEYRLVVLDHLRFHVLTLGWLRRVQIAAYFEAGNVADRMRYLFDERDILYGAGLGLRFHVDLFGINPSVWRFDVAKRLDDYDEETFLFYVGAGHSF